MAKGGTLMTALLEVQREIDEVEKKSDNPYFSSKYADLSSVIDEVKPVLNKHGILFLQYPIQARDGYLALKTVLIHAESGEREESVAEVPLAKSDPQAYGSAITYARRYALQSFVGLKAVDDDAESAMGRTAARTEAPKVPPKFRLGAKAETKTPALSREVPKREKTRVFPSVEGEEESDE